MEVQEKIRSMVAEMLEIDDSEIDDDVQFSDYGLDSFMALELVASIESELGIHIPENRMQELTSINCTIKVINELNK